jgi:hypothetical protein
MEICNNCMREMPDPLRSLGWTVVVVGNPRGTKDDVFYCPDCPPNPNACSDCYELRRAKMDILSGDTSTKQQALAAIMTVLDEG